METTNNPLIIWKQEGDINFGYLQFGVDNKFIPLYEIISDENGKIFTAFRTSIFPKSSNPPFILSSVDLNEVKMGVQMDFEAIAFDSIPHVHTRFFSNILNEFIVEDYKIKNNPLTLILLVVENYDEIARNIGDAKIEKALSFLLLKITSLFPASIISRMTKFSFSIMLLDAGTDIKTETKKLLLQGIELQKSHNSRKAVFSVLEGIACLGENEIANGQDSYISMILRAELDLKMNEYLRKPN